MMTEKTKKFLEKLKESGHWNDDYNYGKVDYVNVKTNVVVIDEKFGSEHLINPRGLLKGTKCCGKNLISGYVNYGVGKEFVSDLHINGGIEWRTYCKSGDKPHNIPSDPRNIYGGCGWVSWSDWLSYKRYNFLNFNDAKRFGDDIQRTTLRGKHYSRNQ